MRKPEVLAPAGGWPQLRAAVENGADAVYFGLAGGFNARARAANFEDGELGEVMAYLHARGVKGFVTLNVLVYDEELAEVERRVRVIADAAVDAVIVQDMAVVELVRRAAPSLAIHGSTQMSITSADGAEFARRAGAARIVVGRELSVDEISQVRAGTSAEVEAFVHGALCVSYSGQCFSSEAWGGRSANRGQCAQACRMPYGLVVGGQLRDLGDLQYLLSPQDLMAVEQIPALVRAGVACFKIEGRLKGPEYVALTTRVYRDAVDAAWTAMLAEEAAAPGDPAQPASDSGLSSQQLMDLQQVFARGQNGEHRGLTPGFLEGPAHQRLVRGRAPRHRGVFAGTVTRAAGGRVWIAMAAPLKRGDGVVFDVGAPDQPEQGGALYDILAADGAPLAAAAAAAPGAEAQLVFGVGCVDARRVAVGSLVWRTSDPALEARLRATYECLPASAVRRLPVDVSVSGRLGEALAVELADNAGRCGRGESAALLAAAARRPLDAAAVAGAVGTLGDSTLALRQLDLSALELGTGLFIPLGEIKAARRAAVARFCASLQRHAAAASLALEPVLPALLAAARGDPVAEQGPREHLMKGAGPNGGQSSLTGDEQRGIGEALGHAAEAPLLRVLCRSKAQADAACQVPWLTEVVLDFLEVHGLREAVAAARGAGKRVVVACPRVLKPGEDGLAKFYLRLGADALLLRSAGLLHRLACAGGPGTYLASTGARIPALEGDFSLNAANAVTADLLLRMGLSRLAPTHDLNGVQLAGLARSLGHRAGALEAIVHHHLPIFHTEHCVFARFLSDGDSYKDCGRPCERATLHLRDGAGADHLVLADQGCRNTVFNSAAQSGLWHLAGLRAAGYGAFRVELAAEAGPDVAPLLETYRTVMLHPDPSKGGTPPGAAWRWLAARPGGVTPGSLAARGDRPAAALKPTAASARG